MESVFFLMSGINRLVRVICNENQNRVDQHNFKLEVIITTDTNLDSKI